MRRSGYGHTPATVTRYGRSSSRRTAGRLERADGKALPRPRHSARGTWAWPSEGFLGVTASARTSGRGCRTIGLDDKVSHVRTGGVGPSSNARRDIGQFVGEIPISEERGCRSFGWPLVPLGHATGKRNRTDGGRSPVSAGRPFQA